MKRLIFVIVVLVFFSSLALPAQEEQTTNFQYKTTFGIGSSLATQYLSLNPAFLWKPDFFGAGLGVKNFLGLNYGDIYIAPYLRSEFGWFYLGGGWTFPVKGPGDVGNVVEVPSSFFATLGLAAPIVDLGPGKLGVDISIDGFVSSIEVDDPKSIEEALLVTPFVAGMGVVLTIPKINAGVMYVIDF